MQENDTIKIDAGTLFIDPHSLEDKDLLKHYLAEMILAQSDTGTVLKDPARLAKKESKKKLENQNSEYIGRALLTLQEEKK